MHNFEEKNNKSTHTNSSGQNQIDTADSTNIWVNILSEVQSSSRTKLSASKNILVLGDDDSGKSSLIARLQEVGGGRGGEGGRRGTAGLEYTYIDVKDEYRDDQTRVGAWLVDGDTFHRGSLKYSLTEHSYPHTCVLLVASLSEPSNIIESLNRWTQILTTHIDRLRIPANIRAIHEKRVIRFFRSYTEPVEGETGGGGGSEAGVGRRPSAALIGQLGGEDDGEDDDELLPPLSESAFTNNLGLPIIVVLTKSDSLMLLEKEFEMTDAHFDFIQLHVRQLALNYGAALVYTSARDNRGCALLYKYIAHRLLLFPFPYSAAIVDRDAIFIPAGWDTMKLISILNEGLAPNIKPTDPFNDVITRRANKKLSQREAEICADDDQVFLARLQTVIAKSPSAPITALAGAALNELLPRSRSPTPSSPLSSLLSPAGQGGGGGEVGGGVGGGMTRSSSSPRVGSVGSTTVTSPPIKKVDSDTGVLANFFNSLLSKRSTDNKTKLAAIGGSQSASIDVNNDTPLDDGSLNSRSTHSRLDGQLSTDES